MYKSLPTIYQENNNCLLNLILPRVIELLYVANDLESFANDCGYSVPPFEWNEERRRQLKSELDAIYFCLYGIQKQDVEYIMETFPIFKAKEVLGGHMCIRGNVPSSLLQAGTTDEVKAYCRQLIDVVGKDGGLIVCPRSSTDEAKPENLKAMIDFTKEYGVYN